jgi:predicted lipase
MVCDFKNGKQDFDAIPIDFEDWGCKNRFFDHKCRVHRGFYQDYLALRTKIREQVLKLASTYPSSQFLVTGVSLGGAIAAIANYDITMYLKQNNLQRKVFSYNYGEPRIGNKKLVEEFNKETEIFRVINQQDPVPHLPPKQIGSLMSIVYFYHPGIEVYYSHNGSIPLVCNGDTIECSFNDNKEKDYNVCNHIMYNKLSFTEDVCNLIVSRVILDYGK